MNKTLIFIIFLFSFILLPVHAANLVEVSQQALAFDPAYRKAIAERMSIYENVPISLSNLLPQVLLSANPSVSRIGNSGINFINPTLNPRNYTARTYQLNLSISQTIFDFSQFYNVSSQHSKAKSADATLNAALQDLIIRVADAYFTILKDEEYLRASEQSKEAYAKQLKQVKALFKARIRPITDVDTAQASYDTALSNYYAALNTLENDRETLRELTGVRYPHLAHLSDQFPVVSPQPQSADRWVAVALKQNWSIKAAQYSTQSALQTVKQQLSKHLPTVNLKGSINRNYTQNINQYQSFNSINGTGTSTNKEIGIDISLPLYSGGQVHALSKQAQFNYQSAVEELEQTNQTVITKTRQSYQSIISAVSRIHIDAQAVAANQRSLHGMEISFKVGIQSLVDLLNQQQKLYQSQIQYASDRYEYVKNLLALKQATGTLSFQDILKVNDWLVKEKK